MPTEAAVGSGSDVSPRDAENEHPRTCVHVCRGKHCKKKAKFRKKALEALGDDVVVHEVKCQKICSGPVFGVERDGTVEWFERVDGDKSRVALGVFARTGELLSALAKRRVPKRRGRLR